QPKQSISFGDEPDLYKKAQGRNSPILNNGNTTANSIVDTSATNINPASGKINLENSSNDCESGYVPTVGRWGAEWPIRAKLTADADKEKPSKCFKAAQTCSSNKNVHLALNPANVDTKETDDVFRYNHKKQRTVSESATTSAATHAVVKESKVSSITEANLTSNPSSVPSLGIGKILEKQHLLWWSEKLKITQLQCAPSCEKLFMDSIWQNSQLWDSDDGYNLSAFSQTNGIWPIGHPLPLPDWISYNDVEKQKGILYFDSVWQYEDLSAIIETKLQRMLEETHYDTIHLFVDFYQAFKRTRRSDLRSFYQFYDIPINRRHHMCVSLAMEIMACLVELTPILLHYLYIVSCEEQVASLSDYIESAEELGGLNSPDANVEKEHAMVAMKICIAGRRGVLILDPGYHVGRAVTIMQDQMYPHTGWFTQSKEQHLQRDYCYKYSIHNNKYIEWMEREIRGDQATYKTSLVYIDQPYVTAIDVTVRRNLVYNFRSLLSRDAKGRVFAGIYLPISADCNDAHFTIFYEGTEQRIKAKFPFYIFKSNSKIPDQVQHHLEKLAPQLNMKQRELAKLLLSLAEVIMDQSFIDQVLAINDDIGNMTTEN
uniref:Uncharacterized protein n=1 Tax=Glossina brevipalpis TaxID=37001 RepID=A0A1A9WXJ6_9MUSC